MLFRSVRPGDRVGFIGIGGRIHWARLAHVTVVARIEEGEDDRFWHASPEVQARALAAFADAGAAVVVTHTFDPKTAGPGWARIGETAFYAVRLTASTKRRTLSWSLRPGLASTPESTSTA